MKKKLFKLLFLLLLLPPSIFANSLPPHFVYLKTIDPSIKQEMRYATRHNFIGRPIKGYDAGECILTKETAQALSKVQTELKKISLSLKVYDCYRPQKAVNDFIDWSGDIKQQEMKSEFYPRVNKADFFKLGYVAKKSGHTRGSTVDLTIVSNVGNNNLEMGTAFDYMDERAHIDSKDLDTHAYHNRALLRALMVDNGFQPYQAEWWHFTLKDEPYPKTYFDFDVNILEKAQTKLINNSQQMLVILTKDWNTKTGKMQRYARESLHNDWKAIGKPIDIVIGKNGLALGVEMQNNNSDITIKKEGDLRTPMGVFPISSAFGFAENEQAIKMPYLPLTNTTFCVDDVNSNYYNQIIDQAKLTADWKSGEQMREVPVYKLGAVVAYNQNSIRGAGSCIFLHIWKDKTKGTAGCIAMSEENLKETLHWLDNRNKPVTAIFTEGEFQKFKADNHIRL